MDPMVKIVLERMQNDPKAAQEVMSDPVMGAKIQKLIMAGIIKMGWDSNEKQLWIHHMIEWLNTNIA